MSKLVAQVAERPQFADSQHAVAVRSMFDRISPTYDLLNRLLSVGIDRAWRRRALDALLRDLPEGPVMDLCAGTLDLSRALQDRAPERPVLAADFARHMLVAGRDKVSADCQLAVADAMRLPIQDGALSGAICGFGMRNLSDPREGLRELHRAMRPGGTLVVLEFFRPTSLLMRIFHGIYARAVLPTVGFMVSRDREAYGYLARSMAGFYSLAEYQAMLTEVGFEQVEGQNLSLGIASLVRAVR